MTSKLFVRIGTVLCLTVSFLQGGDCCFGRSKHPEPKAEVVAQGVQELPDSIALCKTIEDLREHPKLVSFEEFHALSSQLVTTENFILAIGVKDDPSECCATNIVKMSGHTALFIFQGDSKIEKIHARNSYKFLNDIEYMEMENEGVYDAFILWVNEKIQKKEIRQETISGSGQITIRQETIIEVIRRLTYDDIKDTITDDEILEINTSISNQNQALEVLRKTNLPPETFEPFKNSIKLLENKRRFYERLRNANKKDFKEYLGISHPEIATLPNAYKRYTLIPQTAISITNVQYRQICDAVRQSKKDTDGRVLRGHHELHCCILHNCDTVPVALLEDIVDKTALAFLKNQSWLDDPLARRNHLDPQRGFIYKCQDHCINFGGMILKILFWFYDLCKKKIYKIDPPKPITQTPTHT